MPGRLPTRSARRSPSKTTPTRATSAVESPDAGHGEPDLAGWEYARAMQMPYKRCPMGCGGWLMREAPYRVSGKTWLEATCNTCEHQVVMPEGKVRQAPRSHDVVPVGVPAWFREQRERDHAERAAGA